ncbi:MAG TPA: haloacid dehalogenase, partial [Bacteroides sp.]|nr:haloacid dehalogenase [Bacteroides sp.]
CQILWISLLILPFTGTAHLNDIFDLSYKAIFILFVWDYRQLFGLSWWKSFCRTIIMFWYCFLGLLLVCSIIIGIIVLIAYIIQWGK